MSKRFLSLLLAASVAVSGCTPTHYMGISISAPPSDMEQELLAEGQSADPMESRNCADRWTDSPIGCKYQPISALAYEAVFGNKHAQLELGKRFEAGRGVTRDLEKAEELYKRASKTTGGPITTCVWDEYSKSCNIMTIDTPLNYGLAEAKENLTRLRVTLGTE